MASGCDEDALLECGRSRLGVWALLWWGPFAARPCHLYEGPFTVESTYRPLTAHRINNPAAAPTAYRLLLAAGEEAARPIKGQLRVANSEASRSTPRSFGLV